MPETYSDELTEQFYEWEGRGRGWTIHDVPVEREPAFVPFFFHSVTPKMNVDDGRAPSLRSLVFDTWRSIFPKEEKVSAPEPSIVDPIPYECEEDLVALVLAFPKEVKVSTEEMSRVLFLLSSLGNQLSFEIRGDHEKIFFQIVCRESERNKVFRQLRMYFPFLSIKEVGGSDVYDILPEGSAACGIDYGLKHEFMRPIGLEKQFDIDPYQELFALLEHLEEGESGLLQILFSGVVNPWSESIMRSVTDFDGGSFFMDAPEMVLLAKEKVSSPLCAATLRVVGVAHTTERAQIIAHHLGHAISTTTKSRHNTLMPLSNGDTYSADDYFEDIILRQSRRDGMLLNVKELVSLIHLPAPTLRSQKLLRDLRRTKRLPNIAIGHQFVLGENVHMNESEMVTVSSKERFRHTHVIGATGTGKSTLLLNMIVQDIQNNNGVAVLDPHGDLIDEIMEHIPDERIKDVVIIDPSDEAFPVAFNILSAHSDTEKNILSSDLVAVFKRLSTSWGDQMNSVFANAILAFLESSQGGTLVDLRRFLIEKEFRDQFLKTVTDPNVVYYWQKEFSIFKNSSIGPILTKLDTFLRPKLIRNMVAQKKGIDFSAILNKQKILLVKLSHGLIGHENSFLLGSFVVSKLHQAALGRQGTEKSDRNAFFFYVDEFQHFITPSMASLLSGVRKYNLGLILAHQDMQQVIKEDQEVASSLLANAGTRICFRMGEVDAKRFAEGFSYFDSSDLQNLKIGEAIVRIERPEHDCSISIQPMESIAIPYKKNAIIQASRTLYATPKEKVEILFETKEKTSSPQATEVNTQPKENPIQQPKQKKKIELAIDKTDGDDSLHTRQHTYLQTLIKKMAESRGYRAICEEPTADGKGRVDVGLFKNDKRIACEICVTTTDTWELHNITKCFLSGYTTVVVCSTEKKSLEKIKRLAQQELEAKALSNVCFYTPEELFFYLDQEVAKENDSEKRIKGYRVKVEYKAQSPKESEQKEDQILKSVYRVIKRNKK